MDASKKKETIYNLRQVVNLLTAQKKQEDLTENDLKIFSFADSYFGDEYKFSGDYSKFLSYLPPSAVTDTINNLEKEEEQEGRESVETEEQGSSIPPELESMLAEYRANQALLEEEDIKNNHQKTVEEQVKIAIAHQQIRQRALANRDRRVEQGEKIQTLEEAIVSQGSPKSESTAEAFSASYQAVQTVALTYSTFKTLPSEVQEKIIASAVELNSIGVQDVDTAIQASVLQLDTSSLDESVRDKIATIPGGFISTVYNEVVESNTTTLNNEQQISDNEEKIINLQKAGKTEEANRLIEENEHLLAYNENQSVRLSNKLAKQTESFKDFEKARDQRLSQDPDTRDLVEKANKSIASIHNTLETSGVKPHFYTAMDDAGLLEEAIRRDMPGTLRGNSGYEAEYAAALINNPKTENKDLSPEAVLLFGKELTPDLLTKARKFAKDNPDSALGKLLKTRSDIFNDAGKQLRKISNSPLGKEIGAIKTGLNKTFGSVSKFFTRISDKIPGGFGTVIQFASDPWGALRSLAGRKAGEFIAKRFVESLTNETLKKAAEALLKDGLKNTVSKLAQQAATKLATKAAAKAGAKVALEAAAQGANVIPGLGIVIAVAIEAISWIIDKLGKALKKISTAIYGEDVKPYELLVVPVAGATVTIITGIGNFFLTVGSATLAAAGSAATLIIIGSITAFFFYIVSFVTAPLLSTLVQLQSTPSTISQKTCNNVTLTNDKKYCNGSYCFPVNDTSTVSYGTYHHDYNANDIMRIGDTSGPQDDVPLPILAYTSGKVIWTSENDGIGGYAVEIAGTDGMYYYYAHNMCNLVTVGQSVQAGDVIAGMDSSGDASTYLEHLHFQISDQADMTTIPENYPHFSPPWEDFCSKLNMCGPLNFDKYPELPYLTK